MLAWSLTLVGTAIGNLGQHTGTRMTKKYGLLPVFDHRLKVFQQVSVGSLRSPQR